jgi:5'-3' exonuclease
MAEAEKALYEHHKIGESLAMKWIEKYSDDAVVKESLDRLKRIGEGVMNKECQQMEHVKCGNMPEGLDEDTYILVFRKTN